MVGSVVDEGQLKEPAFIFLRAYAMTAVSGNRGTGRK